jgi:phosphoglycerate dehydrogenase-like enzyme
VLVTWMGFEPDGIRTGARLQAAGLRLVLAPKNGERAAAEVARLAAGAVAAIVSTDPFDGAVFRAATALRVIARVGVGTDSIDLDAATEAGVVVTTTPGANRETAADHALAMILAALRRLVEHDASVRRGEWRRGGDLTPWDLHGTTVGLVGYGDIGRAVGRRVVGFGAHVLACDPVEPTTVPLEELLARAHVVSLHLPITAATRGIIGAAELARMPAHAVLVNTSRGGLVDEPALVRALRSGAIRAAALDVFADEPRLPAGLAGLPNVVLTPHIGGLSERSIARMTERATDHVLAVLAGRPERDCVANPEVLRQGGRPLRGARHHRGQARRHASGKGRRPGYGRHGWRPTTSEGRRMKARA